MVSGRIARRIERDFPAGDASTIAVRLDAATAGPWSQTDSEAGRDRVQAAILMIAAGDVRKLIRECEEAQKDWRDVLMAADLGYDDWAVRVGEFLGPP